MVQLQQVVLHQEKMSTTQLIHKAHTHTKAYYKSFDSLSLLCMQEKPHTTNSITWEALSYDIVKLNTDAVVKGSFENVACGGVLRDCNSNFIIGFLAYIGVYSIANAKLWGIYKWLELVYSRGYMRIQLEFDSMIAIVFLTKGCTLCHLAHAIVWCIRVSQY